LNDSIEHQLTARNRFKKAAETIAKEFHVPNKDEQYDFFCKQWEPQKEEPKMVQLVEKLREVVKKDDEIVSSKKTFKTFY
jgi:hypothetical protein